jgi:hypothetical protein
MSQESKLKQAINRVIHPGEVLDTKDPALLGRIRVRPILENLDSILGSVSPPWDEVKDPWSERDPLIFLPLLPFYLSAPVKEKEFVNIIYPSPNYRYVEQYYIPGPLSSPLNSEFENYISSQQKLAAGSKFKNPLNIKNQDGTFKKSSSKGIFPEPEDTGLLGKGNADIIVKKDRVFLRAGKTETMLRTQLPKANLNRGFVEIVNYEQKREQYSSTTVSKVAVEKFYVKKLVEYYIENPENLFDVFNTTIYVYNLKESEATLAENVNVDSNIDQYKSLAATPFSISGLSIFDTIVKINQFLKGFDVGNINIDGYTLQTTEPRPYYYRPSPLTYKFVKDFDGVNNLAQAASVKGVMTGVNVNLQNLGRGYGLINKEGSSNVKPTITLKNIPLYRYKSEPMSATIQAANKLVFLSHDSQIPSLNKIVLSNDTFYGTERDFFDENILPNTNSFVRGEELMKLLDVIVRFLISHVHAYPGIAPVPVGTDGTKTDDILKQLFNAPNTILNKNIRIN